MWKKYLYICLHNRIDTPSPRGQDGESETNAFVRMHKDTANSSHTTRNIEQSFRSLIVIIWKRIENSQSVCGPCHRRVIDHGILYRNTFFTFLQFIQFCNPMDSFSNEAMSGSRLFACTQWSLCVHAMKCVKSSSPVGTVSYASVQHHSWKELHLILCCSTKCTCFSSLCSNTRNHHNKNHYLVWTWLLSVFLMQQTDSLRCQKYTMATFRWPW